MPKAVNPCAKTVKPEQAYEVYATDDYSWLFYVLKKYKSPEKEEQDPYARWYTATSSPMTHGSLEFGDAYCAEIKQQAHLILNPLRPLEETRQPYKVEPDSFWNNCYLHGDGYDVMGKAEQLEHWTAVSSWGRDGWDLGSWPYVIVFRRMKDGIAQLVEYCEGDVTQYNCPNQWIRQQIIDGIAFFYWKHHDDEWVKNYDSIDAVPLDSELRGPYRRR